MTSSVCMLLIVLLLFITTTKTTTNAFFSSLSMSSTSSTSSKNIQTLTVGKGKTNVIAGATGYIGKSVVRESVRQGYNTIALVRDLNKVTNNNANEGSGSKKGMYDGYFEGAQLIQCDVTDVQGLTETLTQVAKNAPSKKVDTLISCLASRSGLKKDAYAIDYQATLNCLTALRNPAINGGNTNTNTKSNNESLNQFILLSAFCVKNPWLQFQKAKLEFESALQSQSDVTWSIVRPTAFFKSVSGQLEVIKGGGPFVMFGNGEVTRCNPISEADLATYMIDSIRDSKRTNQILNIGGPDEPLTMKKQGEMLFDSIGKKPKFFYAPLFLFDIIINTIQFLATIFRSEKLENAAEFGRIGKYYAVEDMLTIKNDEKFGTMTLKEHYDKIATEGQEYDPYTTMFAKSPTANMKS